MEMELPIVSIKPLQLLEGGSVFFSSEFIDVLMDYTKLNIMESGVVFNVAQPPKHGRIVIFPFPSDEANSSVPQSKYFSLIDLNTDKVKYIHSGSEQSSDHMTIDLQLITNNRDSPLPEFIQGKHRFVLHANITSVNDAPTLQISSNRILRLTQGIPKILGPDLLLAEDPDSPPDALIYSMVPVVAVGGTVPIGTIEIMGQAVTAFSQADVNKGVVSFVVNTEVSAKF